MSLEVRQVLCSDTNTDVFVLWQMEAIFSIVAKSAVTHHWHQPLRFNRDGLIHFADFWDLDQGWTSICRYWGPQHDGYATTDPNRDACPDTGQPHHCSS